MTGEGVNPHPPTGFADGPLPLPLVEGSHHSPSTALAMMLRWISLEPPKIEVLRMLK